VQEPLTGETIWKELAIDMIGEMIGDLNGKWIGQRIVKRFGGEPMLERTLEERGTILGVDVTFLATTWSKDRPQGGMFTKGNGIMMTKNGEKATLHGSGITIPGKGHGMSVRGVRYLQTTAPSLSRLNNVALVFELEVTPDGMIHDKMWEWK
jgi:hypothetical protein